MKKSQGIIVAGVVAVMVIFGGHSVWANPYNSYVDQRRVNQEQVVQQAWQSGQLSPGQYRHLQNQLQQIRMVESHMRADGRLSPGEKSQINDMLNHNERDINYSLSSHRRMGWH
jgi:hypothetical protein